MNNEESNEWGFVPHLTEEWFDIINAGGDIRDILREKNALADERTLRLQAALIIVMFERYPLGMTLDEITKAINAEPFDVMEDGAFRMYVDDILASRTN